MKKLLASASLVALVMASGSVFAGGADGTGAMNLVATASNSCTGLTTPSPQDFSGTFDAAHHVVPVSFTGISLGTVSCNYSGAKVGLKTANGGLTNGNVPSSSSVDTVLYTATADWGTELTTPLLAVLNAAGTAGTTANSPATALSTRTNALTLNMVTLADSSKVFTNGAYQDTLSINIGTGF